MHRVIVSARVPEIESTGLLPLISVICGLKEPMMAVWGAEIISFCPSTLIIDLNDCSTNTVYDPHPL